MPRSAFSRLLPSGLHVADIADSCRYAALAYLNGVPSGWGKRELAAWLAGPYRDVTHHARQGLDLAARRTAGGARKVQRDAIERVMRDARKEVIATLRTLREEDGGVAFAFSALGGALVSRCGDDVGDFGWIPISPMRMRLAERILSLIAVDYLARPEDYEQSLAICGSCEIVAFDAAARGRNQCRVHAGSGIRFKERDSYPGELRFRRERIA